MSKYTKRDRAGALAKIEKAGLTIRQINAYQEHVIREAVEEAERDAFKQDRDGTRYRMGGIGSLLSFAGERHAYEAVRVAVYWYHELKNQRIPIPKEVKR